MSGNSHIYYKKCIILIRSVMDKKLGMIGHILKRLDTSKQKKKNQNMRSQFNLTKSDYSFSTLICLFSSSHSRVSLTNLNSSGII